MHIMLSKLLGVRSSGVLAGMDAIRVTLRAALVAAMKRRNRVAVSVYRTTLAAIDNAEAVPVSSRAGALESSPSGVGRSDVARVSLPPDQVRAVVLAEAAERRSAAALLAADPVVADRLRREAALLDAVLAE